MTIGDEKVVAWQWRLVGEPDELWTACRREQAERVAGDPEWETRTLIPQSAYAELAADREWWKFRAEQLDALATRINDRAEKAESQLAALRAEREAICAEALKYADKSGRLEAKVDRLAEALKDLEVCANTIGFCYTRNPGNFAAALRELRESAERSRDALRDHEQEVGDG